MKPIISLLFSFLLAFSVSIPAATAQDLNAVARQAKQRAKELKAQEEQRYNAVVDSKDLDKYNAFIQDYPKGRYTAEIRRRADEMKLWNKARQTNSVASYESYLSTSSFHWFDSKAKDNIRTIRQAQERKAWEEVKRVGTLEAYRKYLADNPQSGYADDAKKEIARIEAKEQWAQLKSTSSTSELEAFITKYPGAAETKYAKTRLHELKAVAFYNEGKYNEAYTELLGLTKSDLAYSNYQMYDKVMEHHDFSKLGNYATESELRSFLGKYPNSNYNPQVNNKLAILKAKKLDGYSTDWAFDDALSYATDEPTRQIVKTYINNAKQTKKELIRMQKAYDRDKNGGWLNIGFEMMNLGYNCRDAESDDAVVYYDLGLWLRFGNYTDRVQFAVGLRPGLISYSTLETEYTYYDSYTTSEDKIGFHMPLVAQLKLNLFKCSETCRFFLQGQMQFNAVRVREVESSAAWSAGCGFAWKHFDWGFFYRQDIGEPEFGYYTVFGGERQYYIGTSMTFYWNAK